MDGIAGLIPNYQTGLVENYPSLIICGFAVLAAWLSFAGSTLSDAIMRKECREFDVLSQHGLQLWRGIIL